MITCPECGLEASDEAKFCDRCGRGLSDAPAEQNAFRLVPRAPGTILKGGYEIVELSGQDSIENRYHAVRKNEGKTEKFLLRERAAPNAPLAEPDRQTVSTVTPPPPSEEENPAGPRAKTHELKPPPESDVERAAPSSDGGGSTHSMMGAAPANDAEAKGVADAAVSNSDVQSIAGATEPPKGGDVLAEATTPEGSTASGESGQASEQGPDDLGEVFGRVLALSLTLDHPAFERALEGFADGGRAYLVYPDKELVPLSERPGGIKMREPEAIALGIQVCQAVSFLHRRGLRLNDICPESIGIGADGRIRILGLDHVSNDNELQTEPIFNAGFTAPEVYRGKKVDKRADIFSIGALLYTALTGERLESESWREEAGPMRFYPPHVVSPAVEEAVRRALLFDVEQRWPSADALKAELLRLSADLKIRSATLTDVGMVRELNEDSVIALEYLRDSKVEPSQSFLYAVCDGMGGAEAGETASAIAVGVIRDYVENRVWGGATRDLASLLVAALEEANLKIIEYQQDHLEARGMGSTAVGALLVPPDASVAWVGDSRAYLFGGGVFRQITKDHSLVQRLVEIGQITPEEARHHEHRNVITRSLGARPSGPAGAESVSFKVRRGDRLLLCSDGLTTHVEDKDISEIIRRHEDPYAAARELIAAANAGGGTDNISVIVIFAS